MNWLKTLYKEITWGIAPELRPIVFLGFVSTCLVGAVFCFSLIITVLNVIVKLATR